MSACRLSREKRDFSQAYFHFVAREPQELVMAAFFVPSAGGDLALTFDDVLLQPNASDVIPSSADTSTLVSKRM